MPFTRHDGNITVTIRLTPNARLEKIGGVADLADGKKALKAFVRAIPENGRANTALIELVAKTLKLPKSTLTLISGDTSRQKVLKIINAGDDVLEKLQALI